LIKTLKSDLENSRAEVKERHTLVLEQQKTLDLNATYKILMKQQVKNISLQVNAQKNEIITVQSESESAALANTLKLENLVGVHSISIENYEQKLKVCKDQIEEFKLDAITFQKNTKLFKVYQSGLEKDLEESMNTVKVRNVSNFRSCAKRPKSQSAERT
jgi:hypothetical protein